MKTVTFKGGVHPSNGKERTKNMRTTSATAPDEIVLPTIQHIGAPAVPCVEVGQEVLLGQLAAEPGGFISAAVHSSVSGTVTAIEPRMGVMGIPVLSIVIKNDRQDRSAVFEGIPDWKSAGPKILKEKIREAGVVGMGGAAFPTHVKLSPPEGKTIDTALLNGAECEPMLTADHRLMLERPFAIVEGLQIIQRILGATVGAIGIEQNKPDAIVAMEKAALGTDIKIVPMKMKYPQGAEKQLIYSCLKRKVPTGKLPMDVGCVVQNVGTACAIRDAVVLGHPVTGRIVTVSGSAVATGGNFWVRIGTAVSSVIKDGGGVSQNLGKLIVGGPMMGVSLIGDQVPVTKVTSGLLLFTENEIPTTPAGPCIRCGRCIRVCPMRLVPTDIATFGRLNLAEEAERADALDCMLCGSCAFGCPARIPLTQEIRLAKALIHAAKRQNK